MAEEQPGFLGRILCAFRLIVQILPLKPELKIAPSCAYSLRLFALSAFVPDRAQVQVDYFLLAAGTEAIGRRCEYLMRLCEKEVEAGKREKEALEAAGEGGASGPATVAGAAGAAGVAATSALAVREKSAALKVLSLSVSADKRKLVVAKELKVNE